MNSSMPSSPLLSVRESAHSMSGGPQDFDPLMDAIGNSRFVLLGEATHGTHEFYRVRAEITKKLILEKGFSAVAIEGDWPDAYRVNRYIQGIGADNDATDALTGFRRFPTWMWRNADVLDFIGWLRNHNDACKSNAAKIGFYGLDLYSLHASMAAVIQYLEKIDPESAKRARARYSCFDNFGQDPQNYGRATYFDVADSCREEVLGQLRELHEKAAIYLRRDGIVAEDELFSVQQNARLVKDAEAYYRTMFSGHVSSWNLRDQHMFETLKNLYQHYHHRSEDPKIVVWEHNSHLGDARATYMADAGEFNIGQLVRQQYGSDSFSVGFTTYQGTVTAASAWGGPAERKSVRPALAESYESLFHATDLQKFLLIFRGDQKLKTALKMTRLERAIGVLYLPETERQSHYFPARITEQFDAVIHFDQTRAVEPLERTSLWDAGELPETFPSGV